MSINSHCIYLNTPVGGGGVRHTVFCITWTNTKNLSTTNHTLIHRFIHCQNLYKSYHSSTYQQYPPLKISTYQHSYPPIL